jgi:1,4-alpha-glucan branching enzyme
MSMPPALEPHLEWAMATGQLDDPFSVLGPRSDRDGTYIRVYLPGATSVRVLIDGQTTIDLNAVTPPGLFVGRLPTRSSQYLLEIVWPAAIQTTEDPYSFPPLLSDLDLHLINEGRHFALGRTLGAHISRSGDVSGVRFAVWAPNARSVSVVGDFNSWDGRRHPMRRRGASGVWELFLPRIGEGARYKYQIVASDGRRLPLKADPVANATELPPRTASVVPNPREHTWNDQDWLKQRALRQGPSSPMSIYELHAGSWLRPSGSGELFDWIDLAERIIPYVKGLNFTHLELMPVAEHPFSGSWGYQPLGLFAPSRRFGDPGDFRIFVDACHRADLGVLVDWVPAHFPSDEHGLAQFDGTSLYEHQDPREGFHQDWNTLIYNFGRREVSGFLIASALHWLEYFHIDGLRVDAVASMLYRDYSRQPGEWIPNRYGGRENLEAVDFIRHLNSVVAERCPGAIMVAEESTAWPGVTKPVSEGGLGFAYKWNMGWMNDTLSFIKRDPIYRRHHHSEITFGLVYAFSEHFILPLSHDEVVHGKKSLIGKMPGDTWQKFATLRAYLAFMWGHPGKKLLFMGDEIAQEREWNADTELDWYLLENSNNGGIQKLVRDLNGLYLSTPALHQLDATPDGFRWLVGEDHENSVFAFARYGSAGGPVIVVVNMTPVVRHAYRIGVPHGGLWREVLNSDAASYNGTNVGNYGGAFAQAIAMHGQDHSIDITLPPLATLFFRQEGDIDGNG